jgi:hypothetical protein
MAACKSFDVGISSYVTRVLDLLHCAAVKQPSDEVARQFPNSQVPWTRMKSSAQAFGRHKRLIETVSLKDMV